MASFLSGPPDSSETHYYVNYLMWSTEKKRQDYIDKQSEARRKELEYTSYEADKNNVAHNFLKEYLNTEKIMKQRGVPFGDYRHVLKF